MSANLQLKIKPLTIEIEDEYVLFYDHNYKLIRSVLAMVLKEELLSIYHCRINELMSDDITFKTGHVYINAIVA